MFWLWTGFIVFVLVMLGLDLFVVNRRAHVVGSRESIAWTLVTVVLALAFSAAVYVMYAGNWLGIADHLTAEVSARPHAHASVGREAMAQFIAGWLTEYALSLDNLFVIAVIFAYFRVPARQQHRVLFWGVLGALLMRGAMIGVWAVLLARYGWMSYLLGGFLILAALRMLVTGDEAPNPERNVAIRMARRFFPVTPGFVGDRFFARVAVAATEPDSAPRASFSGTGEQRPRSTTRPTGEVPDAGGRPPRARLAITPLFLVLVVVETTDAVFAVGSIPAIFSITTDPFLVFTSNVFAVLGLRSLYFALAAVMGKFRYLRFSLVFILVFVGVKMLLAGVQHIRTEVSLAIIVGILAIGLGASLLASRRDRTGRPAPVTDLADAAEVAWRRSRRYIIFVVGCTVVLLGLAVGWLPGPGGIPIILAGLAILATEFVWAQRILHLVRRRAESALRRQGPWVTIIGFVTLLAGVGLMIWHHRYWGIPIVVFGAAILATELVYGRYLRRRGAPTPPPRPPPAQRPPGAA